MHTINETEPLAATMFTLRRVGDGALVRITCPALRERQAEVLSRRLEEIADRVNGRLAVEVSGVKEFGCAWINALLSVTNRCASLGGRFLVVGMSRRSMKLLRNTGLTRHLHLGRDEHDALGQLGCPVVSNWRLAIARAFAIPVAPLAARTAA